MRAVFFVLLALAIITPIGMSDAFGEFIHDNVCNSLKHIPSDSWKLFLCSTVEINEDTLGITLVENARFGNSVANIGDLDLDGVNDLAVGSKRDHAGGTDRGAVYILFMNTDGSVKSTAKIDHTTTNGPTLRNVDRFGDSIANMGDLNGDGINDLAVGAANDDTKSNGSFGGANWDAGAVHILFLNRDGSLARATAVINDFTTNGPVLAKEDAFGGSVANMGDLDGNGYDDLAASAMKDHANDRGAVHILFMDENGGLAKATETIDGTTTNGPTLGNGYWFGGSVANIGDFDGNGVDDLAVGANLCCGGAEDKGAIYILFMDEDPGNGLAKATVAIDDTTTNGPTLSDNDRFGNAVANMGDMDGNGVNDLAVGARLDDEGGASSGAVHILFMNSDGSVEETIEINSSTTHKGPTLSAGDSFGTGLANIGDLNGNGVNDLVVGADRDNGDNEDVGAVHILFLTDEIKKKGSTCWDCTRPAITYHGHSETPDGFSINDAIFENNQELYNENPTIEATVGDMVTIKARAWDNRGPENIVRVFTYLDMYEEKPNWHESEAYIEYNIKKDEVKFTDKNNIFALVGASSEVAVNPYYEDGKLKRPLELLDITFTIIFAKPMEPSHIAIQTIDDAANYELVYFEDALKIKEKEIVEIPEVPEEVIPEPEPPVKEPEPEVIPTALIKKGVLSFVDDDVPAKHYVKRYITETEYREWFDVNYSEYQFWEGIGITEEKFDQIVLEIQSEPKPKMIQTGFVLVPDDQKSFPLVEETYEPEPAELEPVKEKKGFLDWLFSLFG